MTFTSPEEMYEALQTTDLYSREKEQYVFLYNNDGAIAVYPITVEEAEKLASLSAETDEYWGAFLGIGGDIYDDPWEFCDTEYLGEWVSTDGFIDEDF